MPATIAVLGAGHVGPVIARMAVAAGYAVSISGSGDPEKIALITEVLVPGAVPRWTVDAVGRADLVLLAIPLHKLTTLDSDSLADKLVIDAMNYWPPADGVLPMFEDQRHGSSEVIAQWLSRSTIVKTLNHLGYHQLEDERRAADSPQRRALGIAGDDLVAVDVVADLIDRIGFDPVRLDTLIAGRILQPGGPVFGEPMRRSEFESAVGADDLSGPTLERNRT